MSVSGDQKNAVAAYVQHVSGANKGIIYLKLRGLDEERMYKIPEFPICLSGTAVMDAGLPMP